MEGNPKRKFLKMPQTQLGWWAVGLSILFIALFLLTTTGTLHFSGMGTMILGIIAGILTLLAILWKRERSWLIWLMLLPGLFAIAFSAGEVIVPH